MKKVAGILYKYPFLLFTLFLVIAYLPVFLPFFHIKNDLVTQNLPSRFVISESLYSGYFPWWNPFIHYGIPQYGNMNTGFWNPFLWLIASTTGYSIYSITYEEMFYLLIGTWGIYKLIKEFTNKEAAVLTGLAYCCSGYAIGHLQHFIWITGVAFFPYVLFFLLRTYKNPLLKNFIGAGISTFIFIASTHPGLVIGAIYFILFIIAFIFLFRKNVTQQLYSKHFWEITILIVISIVLSSIVVIISNLDILQHISRGSKVSLAESLLTPTTLQSYLSLLFPLPVHKTSFFNTDISMRNVYGGLLLLPGLLLFLMKQNWKIIISIAIPLGFFFLLAMGGIFKTFAWHYIPYTGYVRLNGEFTYFVLLILLLLAANGFNDMFANKKYSVFYKKVITKIFLFYSATAVVSIFILIFRSSFTSSGFSDQNFKEFVRSFFEKSSFTDLLFIQSLIQVASLLFIKKFHYSFKASLISTGVNAILITWLCLPFTGLGLKSKAEIEQVINTFPKGIPIQSLTPVSQTKFITSADKREFTMLSSYSKKIGHPEIEDYPVQLNSSQAFFADTSLMQFINRQAWLFLSDDTTINSITSFNDSAIIVQEDGPGKIKCHVHNYGYKYIVLLQNDYPYWKVKIDDKPVAHFTSYKTFVSVRIPNGDHDVQFLFNPIKIKTAMWINISILLILLTILCIPKWRNKRLFIQTSPLTQN